MKARWIVAVLAIGMGIAIATPAHAGTVKFDFEGTKGRSLSGSSADWQVEDYMRKVYGYNSIDIYDVDISSSESTSKGWPGNKGLYLRNDTSSGDMEILFQSSYGAPGIYGMKFDWKVIDGDSKSVFRYYAYADGWGNGKYDEENPDPNKLVTKGSFTGSSGNSGWIDFGEEVELIVFSDSGKYAIAVDNMYVADSKIVAAPLPPAAWLGFAMLASLVGVHHVRRRRRTAV